MTSYRITKMIPSTLLALAFVAAASVAQASTITETGTYGPATTDFSTNIDVSQYSGAGLEEVIVTLSGAGTSVSSVTNTNVNQAETFYVTETSTLTATSSATSALNDNLSYTSGVTTLGASDTSSLGTASLTGSSVSETLTGSELAAFEGSGDIDFLVNTLSGYGVTGGGDNVTVDMALQDDVTVTVEYIYGTSVTPEPGTLGLFGTGLLGLAGLVRRRYLLSR